MRAENMLNGSRIKGRIYPHSIFEDANRAQYPSLYVKLKKVCQITRSVAIDDRQWKELENEDE